MRPMVLSRCRQQTPNIFLKHASNAIWRYNLPRKPSEGNCASRWSSAATAFPASLPLAGVTVVSLEQAIAGPLCTRHLADQGARVIKVERPDGGDFARDYDRRVGGLASHFVWCNRSKESLTLNLKKAEDLAVLKQLLSHADVFVQNLAPGASSRLGLSYDALSSSNPRLIVCDISGYGSEGPYRDKKAYDLLIQSEAGLLSVTGTEEQPAKAGISIADIAAGMYAYSNILAAIIQRQKTLKGRRIDISMLESMVEWMNFPLYYAYDGAPGPKPQGSSHATIYPYGLFETGDGNSIMLGLQNEREWVKLCTEVLEDPGLAHDPHFVSNSHRTENRDELYEIICKAFSGLTAEEVVTRLDKAGIANAKVNDMAQVWEHPQLAKRDRWRAVETSVGLIPMLLPPGASASENNVHIGAVPKLGEHNDKILKELRAGSLEKQ